jgi:3',5'-cyclic-AMP phosphodiesterase
VRIFHNDNADGINRRGFLECMAWAGTGVVWSHAAGVFTSRALGDDSPQQSDPAFTFVQISDSHIGFKKPANLDVSGTLQAVVDKINSLPRQPDFVIHTGDLTHTSKAAEFDTMAQILKGLHQPEIFYVPGEHDTAVDDGKQYLNLYGKGTKGRGWYSFDHKGTHFVGLVNVGALEGLGRLGNDQIAWLKSDLSGLGASTPVVVFAHVPLWTVYHEWGWETEDSAEALTHLRRFGSVTVLNGHIHQVLQKVEGNIAFHTGMSTAFPQPRPGSAPSPGPMKVPEQQLRSLLGVATVQVIPGRYSLAVVDNSLTDPKLAEETMPEPNAPEAPGGRRP